MAVKIQFRRDTASAWTTANPILSQGEAGYEFDTGRFKVGNGLSPWNSLPYSSGVTGPTGPSVTGPTGPQGAASTVPGPTGPQGAQGPIGNQGPIGPTGPVSTVPGPTGATGAQGPIGAASTVPGPQGPTGATGAAGTNGTNGVDGLSITGPTGETGASGVVSVTGPITNTGTPGAAELGLDQSLLSIANTQVTGLGTASTKDIPATGDASTTQVVYGSDTRLTDTRTPTDLSVTTAKIVDANVTNAKLENSAITIGTTSVSLGGSITSPEFTNLTVNGTVTFEGTTADGFETTLSVVDPTADRAIALPNSNGTVALLEPGLASGHMPTTAIDVAPRLDNRSATFTSGTVYWTFFTPLVTLTVNSVSVASAGTATTGATLVKSGIYSFDETTATRLAYTANDASVYATRNTIYTRALNTSVTLTAGVRYGFAVLVIATTPGTGFLAFGYPPAPLNALGPVMRGYLDAQTDLPTTATPFTNTSNGYWGRLL